MKRVGLEEKKLDSRTESSFYPGVFKPRVVDAVNDGRPGTASSRPQEIVATPTITKDAEGNDTELDEADLFLPCHYFNYIGGTSTGGYASLSKFKVKIGC
jgi:hypothetical protein